MKVAKKRRTAHHVFIPDRQYHNLQYGWCAVPLAVVIGSFHHEVISTLRQVGIGDGTLIGEIVPFFVITIQFISKSVVFAGNVVRYDKFQRESRLPGFQRDAFRIADVFGKNTGFVIRTYDFIEKAPVW